MASADEPLVPLLNDNNNETTVAPKQLQQDPSAVDILEYPIISGTKPSFDDCEEDSTNIDSLSAAVAAIDIKAVEVTPVIDDDSSIDTVDAAPSSSHLELNLLTNGHQVDDKFESTDDLDFIKSLKSSSHVDEESTEAVTNCEPDQEVPLPTTPPPVDALPIIETASPPPEAELVKAELATEEFDSSGTTNTTVEMDDSYVPPSTLSSSVISAITMSPTLNNSVSLSMMMDTTALSTADTSSSSSNGGDSGIEHQESECVSPIEIVESVIHDDSITTADLLEMGVDTVDSSLVRAQLGASVDVGELYMGGGKQQQHHHHHHDLFNGNVASMAMMMSLVEHGNGDGGLQPLLEQPDTICKLCQ